MSLSLYTQKPSSSKHVSSHRSSTKYLTMPSWCTAPQRIGFSVPELYQYTLTYGVDRNCSLSSLRNLKHEKVRGRQRLSHKHASYCYGVLSAWPRPLISAHVSALSPLQLSITTKYVPGHAFVTKMTCYLGHRSSSVSLDSWDTTSKGGREVGHPIVQNIAPSWHGHVVYSVYWGAASKDITQRKWLENMVKANPQMQWCACFPKCLKVVTHISHNRPLWFRGVKLC